MRSILVGLLTLYLALLRGVYSTDSCERANCSCPPNTPLPPPGRNFVCPGSCTCFPSTR
ncbi:hypothetical protein PGT21_005111 [Puccinia graminis f. sp. tritici]|uniref:Uncharacterized protein n=1 Tax=Puccinia graminis f. sp. tritici TaxID=56615 RepID=A0A5B0P9X9_PUCGR|nr:hypothetical protein PGT21_005135 [Puccinia graminis f. sp. tritici]KAA1101037.1 hypothetical protein PGT21_005111 [Puccinia graminis f. sp. tritici]KAA1134255.1 hypothetical protein PGTUg99_033955 [Puccinia graminis f. sp. tritici]